MIHFCYYGEMPNVTKKESYHYQIYHCWKVKSSFHEKLFQKKKIIVMNLCPATLRSFVVQWSSKIAGHRPQLNLMEGGSSLVSVSKLPLEELITDIKKWLWLAEFFFFFLRIIQFEIDLTNFCSKWCNCCRT